MKIKEIEIYGYGKWVDTQFTDIASLQIYYGKNEAGKTTLMSFIHSVLFGFPTKQSSELRYEPKESTRYGGRLTVTDTPYGDAVIERVKGKANGDVTVTLSSGIVGSDELLESILYGIDKKTYQTLFSFDLDGLQQMQKMNQKKLNRYFLSIGTLGNEQLLRVADKFEKKANELYKPTGRKPKINQKVRQVEAKRKQVQTAKEKNQQYMEFYQLKSQLDEMIQQSKDKRIELEEKIQDYQRLNVNWSHYAEMQSIQQQMTKEKLTDLPEEGLYQLNNLQERIGEIKQKITAIHEELLTIQKKQEPSRKLRFYFNNEAIVEELLTGLTAIQQQAAEQEQLQVEVHQLEQQIIQKKFGLGLAPDSVIPEPLTNQVKQRLYELKQSMERIEQERAEAKEKEQYLNYQNQSLFQQLDAIEQRLWSQEKFQDAEKEYKKRNAEETGYTTNRANSKQKLTSKKRFPVFIAFGIIAVISGLLIRNFIGYGLIGIVILSVLWGLKKKFSSNGDSFAMPPEADEVFSYISYEDFIQQKELKKQWLEKLAENDQVTFDLNQIRELIIRLDHEWNKLQKEETGLKQEYGYPTSFSITDSEVDTDPFQAIRGLNVAIRSKEKRIAELEQSVGYWSEKASILESVVFLDWNSFPSIINGLLNYKKEVADEGIQRNQLLQSEKEVHNRLQHWDKQQKELEAKRTELFRSIQVKDEDEFRRKYILFQNLTDKKDRLSVLETQLIDDLNLYNQFKDQAELKESIQKNVDAIEKMKQSEEEMLNAKINYELSMQRLEEGGEYSVLLQEMSNLENELQVIVDEWSSYKAASTMIERTLNLAKKDRFPQTIIDTATFFTLLTRGNYQNVFVEEEQLLVQRQDGALFDAAELSKGTAEQLYVALRFAFVKNTSDLVKLPLLIDDGFVNFDSQRKNEMFELMNQMSQTTQVLYFTFDETINQSYPQETIEML